MSIAEKLIGFGIRQALAMEPDEVIAAVENSSQAIQGAMVTANDRAWQTLAVALGGEEFLVKLKELNDKPFRTVLEIDNGDVRHIKDFLDSRLPYEKKAFAAITKPCMTELKLAYTASLISATRLSLKNVAHEAASFKRIADALDDAVEPWAGVFDAFLPNCPHLASLKSIVTLTGPPLLISAFAYFLQHELEKDEKLAQVLVLGLQKMYGAQEAEAFGKAGKALESLGKNFGRVLDQFSFWLDFPGELRSLDESGMIEKSFVTPGEVSLDKGKTYELVVEGLPITNEQLASFVHLWQLSGLRLVALALIDCEQLTNIGFAHLQGLTGLEILNLADCKHLTGAGLSHLQRRDGLRELNLSGCVQLTDAGLTHLRNLDGLQTLWLSKCVSLTDLGLACLSGLHQLNHLDLSGCESFTIAGFACLDKLSRLQNLSLSGCVRLTDAGLTHLQGLTRLQGLSLSKCSHLTDVALAHLRGLGELRILNLSGCVQLTDAGLVHLQELTQLQSLDLSGCNQLTDEGLVHLKDLGRLQDLALCDCNQLTNLSYLRKLTGLQGLDLNGCVGLANQALAYLGMLTELQRLNLSGCERLQDRGLAQLEQLTRLQSLGLAGCNRLTDNGLSALSELVELRQLDLSWCHGLTECGLEYLTGLTNLKELRLGMYGHLTASGLRDFHQALPNCRVVPNGLLAQLQEWEGQEEEWEGQEE
jgi:hypothetical protein